MIKTDTFSWKKRILLFLISQCITLFGSTLVQMAIVWYVTLNTSSGIWVAAFSICSYLPEFLVSFIGGVWADRYNRKKLIIEADFGIATVTFLMILIMPRITEESMLLYILLVMSAIRSIGAGIQTPAVNAIIPQLVPEEYFMRLNGINSTMQSFVRFAAPAAGGVLLTFSSLRLILLVDVVTAAIGIGMVSLIYIPQINCAKETVSMFEDLKVGIHYAFANKFIWKVLIVYGLFTFLCVPGGFLAGLLVSRVFGDTYWYLTAVELAGFAGMIGGGLLMSTWGGFKNDVTTLVAGLAVFGIMSIGMGKAENFVLYLILMVLYGIALTIVQTATTTLIQQKTEMAMHGRVFGLLGSMYAGFMPVGMGIFGPMADAFPLQWIMIGAGLILILIAGMLRFDFCFYKIDSK